MLIVQGDDHDNVGAGIGITAASIHTKYGDVADTVIFFILILVTDVDLSIVFRYIYDIHTVEQIGDIGKDTAGH